jgi:hypothetical protein
MRFAIALAVGGLVVVSPPLPAQDRTLSGRGSGSLQLPDGRSVELYQLNFSQSGQAVTFAFLGRNTALPYTLEGQVTGNPAITTLTIELTGGLRDRATRGTARVVFSGADIGSVSADGTMRQGTFRLRFRSSVQIRWAAAAACSGVNPLAVAVTASWWRGAGPPIAPASRWSSSASCPSWPDSQAARPRATSRTWRSGAMPWRSR